MAEWSKAVVLKAIVCKYRGFESLFARKKMFTIITTVTTACTLKTQYNKTI